MHRWNFAYYLSSVPVARCRDRPSSGPHRPAGVALTSLALSIIVYSLDASAERVGAYKTKAMLSTTRGRHDITKNILMPQSASLAGMLWRNNRDRALGIA